MTELAPDFRFRRVGRAARYPYEEWSDGQTRIATRGVDFDCSVGSFQHLLWTYARRAGLRARTQRIESDRIAFRLEARPAANVRPGS